MRSQLNITKRIFGGQSMKNLPDKVYLATTEEIQNLDNTFVGIAHSNPEDIVEPVEYIRKDVFMERACKWLQKEVVEDYAGVVWEGLIEDFKKYMKGE